MAAKVVVVSEREVRTAVAVPGVDTKAVSSVEYMAVPGVGVVAVSALDTLQEVNSYSGQNTK